MKIIVCVFNNLATDQRIEKVCKTLFDNGYPIELIGNSWGGLPELKRPYPVTRIHLKAKVLRYAYIEFNKKLYSLLKKKIDKNTILVANDLDTILPTYLISKKFNIPLVYDSHEIFTEMPSVQGRFVQKIWRALEKAIYPKLQYRISASDSYANWYRDTYKVEKAVVIQNFPRKIKEYPMEEKTSASPKVIMYQGAINPSRGLDKIIPAMKQLQDAELWIAGQGPKLKDYKELAHSLGLENQVKFLGNLAPEKLREVTVKSDVGLSIEENNGLSYYYSLPNKISDYIQARVPVVVSDFPEMGKIVRTYHVGETIENHTEDELVTKVSIVLKNGRNYYGKALENAAKELCWEKEEEKILELYAKVVAENF